MILVISMVCNRCKNLLEEMYISAIFFRAFYYCIASEINTNNYGGRQFRIEKKLPEILIILKEILFSL